MNATYCDWYELVGLNCLSFNTPYGMVAYNAVIPFCFEQQSSKESVVLAKEMPSITREDLLVNENNGADEFLLDCVKQVAEKMPSKEKLRILEIGCGAGDRFEALARYGSVSGVDEDDALVKTAQEAHPSASVRSVDFCNLPFEEEFDLVLSDAAFSLIADQIGLLKSVARSLVLEGMLAVQMGGEGNLACLQEGFAQSLAKHSGGYSCQFCFPKESAYKRVLDIAGLSVVSMQTIECPTELPGGKEGLRLFAEKHFSGALGVYRPQDRDVVIHDFEDACRDDLWDAKKGMWVADRCILRFVAKKVRRAPQLGGSAQFTVLVA